MPGFFAARSKDEHALRHPRNDVRESDAHGPSGCHRCPAHVHLECFGERPDRPLCVLPEDHLRVADLVAITPPEPIAKFLAARNYLPRGVPLLKHVLGLTGQTVCRIHLDILIDGIVTATARERDRNGRPLPDWQGCRRIAGGENFLMNWQATDLLDGRYFGPLPAASIIGRVVPLYTFEAL